MSWLRDGTEAWVGCVALWAIMAATLVAGLMLAAIVLGPVAVLAWAVCRVVAAC